MVRLLGGCFDSGQPGNDLHMPLVLFLLLALDIVLNYVDGHGKRHTPSKSTGLPVKGNKKRAEKLLMDARAAQETELEAKATEQSAENISASLIPFTEFLLDWLEMTKKNVEETAYGAYAMGIKSKIIPYFEEQHPGLALQNVTPKHIQDYYTYELTVRGVSANTVIQRHANIRKPYSTLSNSA